jgi:hypothetical protein
MDCDDVCHQHLYYNNARHNLPLNTCKILLVNIIVTTCFGTYRYTYTMMIVFQSRMTISINKFRFQYVCF